MLNLFCFVFFHPFISPPASDPREGFEKLVEMHKMAQTEPELMNVFVVGLDGSGKSSLISYLQTGAKAGKTNTASATLPWNSNVTFQITNMRGNTVEEWAPHLVVNGVAVRTRPCPHHL